MPVIMIAQMECILYTTVLRPMHKKVLDQLNYLVKENKRQYWLTIYLTMFILLHSCAMVSRRDWEVARQYSLRVSTYLPTYLPTVQSNNPREKENTPHQVSYSLTHHFASTANRNHMPTMRAFPNTKWV